VTLRLGVIHAIEALYHASIARAVTKGDRQIACMLPKTARGLPIRPAIFDPNIPAFDKAGLRH